VSRGLAATLALALGLLASPLAHAAPKDRPKDKPKEEDQPNIVLMVTDDQTLEMLNNETMPETLRLIGGQGTTFNNAIATTPLCCPSRASMITGQYGHNNGVLENRYRLLNKKRNVLPSWLKRSNYTTIHVGRYLNGYERVARARTRPAPGWQQWHSLIKPRRYYGYTLSVNGGTVPYPNSPEAYLTTVLTQRAVDMVERFGSKRRPFYLQYDHFAPHVSGGTENGGGCVGAAIPGPQDENAFENHPLPRPASFNEEDMSDKPTFMQSMPRLTPDQIDNMQRRYRCALGSLREVDRSVVAIDQALDAIGEKEETVFIFTSDNGYYYGEHRIPSSKNYPYQEAAHVPLLIRAPRGLLDGVRPPAKVNEPVANIDIAPTILAFAGSDSCKKPGGHRCRTMDGRSLLPLLRREKENYPDDRGLLIELDRESGFSSSEDDVSGICAYQGVHASGYRYIEHTEALDPTTSVCAPIHERELYDLTADPNELSSQATPITSTLPPSELQAELAGRLNRLRSCAGIRGRDKDVRSRPFCE
jgi:arylsulfatase A-like enzyme